MGTKTWLITVSVSVELPEELVDDDMPKPELLHDIPDVVTDALAF